MYTYWMSYFLALRIVIPEKVLPFKPYTSRPRQYLTLTDNLRAPLISDCVKWLAQQAESQPVGLVTFHCIVLRMDEGKKQMENYRGRIHSKFKCILTFKHLNVSCYCVFCRQSFRSYYPCNCNSKRPTVQDMLLGCCIGSPVPVKGLLSGPDQPVAPVKIDVSHYA